MKVIHTTVSITYMDYKIIITITFFNIYIYIYIYKYTILGTDNLSMEGSNVILHHYTLSYDATYNEKQTIALEMLIFLSTNTANVVNCAIIRSAINTSERSNKPAS